MLGVADEDADGEVGFVEGRGVVEGAGEGVVDEGGAWHFVCWLGTGLDGT